MEAGMQMRLAFEGLSATVEVPDCPEFLAALKASAVDWPFRRLTIDPAGEPAARITGGGEACVLHFPQEDPIEVTPVAAACSLMVSLAEVLVEENPERLCFHGGAALFAGRLVIFPGRSRAGKSTLIARLAGGGHTIFGDDILPLDGEGKGLALGVAPRLRLPLPAAARAPFRDFVARHAGASDGRYHYLALPQGGLARRGTSAPLGAVVLLDRHPAGPASIHEAPKSLALKLLAAQNIAFSDDARPLLARMRAMVERLPCYVLAYSDLEDAVALIEASFAGWPPRPPLSPLCDTAALTARLLASDREDEGEAEPVLAYRPGMRLVRAPGIDLHEVEGETFLAGAQGAAAFFHLNAVGAGIWNLLAEPVTAEEAIEALATAFPETDRAIIARDVEALLAELARAGLVRES